MISVIPNENCSYLKHGKNLSIFIHHSFEYYVTPARPDIRKENMAEYLVEEKCNHPHQCMRVAFTCICICIMYIVILEESLLHLKVISCIPSIRDQNQLAYNSTTESPFMTWLKCGITIRRICCPFLNN